MAATATATVKATATIVPCDDRCMFASSDECDCQCEGVNHQQGHRLTAIQRRIVRTAAGRRVQTMQPGSQAHKDALMIKRLRDQDGFTQKEIAALLGWSAPTVRRTLRSLTVSEAAAEEQAAQAA